VTTEEPSKDAAHPVATSEHPKTVGRGLSILIVAMLLAGAAGAFYWVF
jgi:hypothetical protein